MRQDEDGNLSAGRYSGAAVFEISFNEISAREMSALPKHLQLQLMAEFEVGQDDLEGLARGEDERFGIVEREGKRIYRFRTKEYRIYFEVVGESIIVHRVLSRNTFRDFLYRTKLPTPTSDGEDSELGQAREFWELIEEGQKSRRAP